MKGNTGKNDTLQGSGNSKLLDEVAELRRRVEELEALQARQAHTEETLRRSEEQLRLITDVLPVCIVYVDAHHQLRFGNRACEEWLGRARARMYGMRIEEVLGKENYAAVRGYIDAVLSGRMLSFETVVPCSDEGICHASIILIPHIGQRDDIKGFVALISDITSRKREEEAFAREREHLSAVLDWSPMATFVIDRDHKVVLWNRACTALTNIPKEDALGKRLDIGTLDPDESLPILADLILEMDDEQLMHKFGKHSIQKDGVHKESFRTTRRIRIKGEEKILAMQAIRLRDENGEVVGAIQCAHDITEQQRLERHLRQVQKMEAIGTLAGGIAHDFNNILMILNGYTEMALRRLPEDSPVQTYLEQMLKASNRGRDLVQQILAFSRQNEQERRPIELGPIIKESLKLLRASLSPAIEMPWSIEPEAGTVLADPIQIHQVLMNLCANAAHAMQDKGGVLEVRLEGVDLNAGDTAIYPDLVPGPHLRLTVSDTGCGMPREIVDRIFDPFFTTKEPGEGTGMGLAVVHGIVKSHNGAITVESEPGKGSTFEVLFPRITQGTGLAPDASSLIPAGNERILLVGDEDAPLHSASQMLENLGYKVTPRVSGSEALEVFRSRPDGFDLVITDHCVPRIDGRQLAVELLEIRADIPIILCTGYDEQIEVEKAMESGVRECIAKPLTIRDLAHAVRRVLDNGC